MIHCTVRGLASAKRRYTHERQHTAARNHGAGRHRRGLAREPGGGGLLRYLITGVLGAVVGGWLFTTAGWRLNLRSELLEQIAVSAIGAMILVLLARLIA
jgi:uncharacterized membrane protein YeaQ/YmgE (transglycosylase-associated protein family)